MVINKISPSVYALREENGLKRPISDEKSVA